jgi:large subunit ribosomal protein L17
MAMIELVDYNEVYKSEATEKKKTRRRGGKAKTTASETVIEVKEETAPVAEEAIPEIDTKNDEDTENAK